MALLALVLLPSAYAAEQFYIDTAKTLFPQNRISPNSNRVLLFMVEDCPCMAIADSTELIHYIFVLPREREKKGAPSPQKAYEVASGLTTYLKRKYGNARLYPFDDNHLGYAIAIESAQKTETVDTYYTLTNLQTTSAIKFLINGKGTFFDCEDGNIIIKHPSGTADHDYGLLRWSLYNEYVDVVEIVLGKHMSYQERKITKFIKKVLDINELYTAADDSTADSKIKQLRHSTGATKGIAIGNEVNVVKYNKKVYVGNTKNLRLFIRNKKRPAKLSFPQESNSIPVYKESNTSKARSTTVPHQATLASNTINLVRKHLACNFIRRDNLYLFHLEKCLVAIPAPPKRGSENNLDEPYTCLYIRCDSGETADSHKCANYLLNILNLSSGKTKELGQGVILKEISGSPRDSEKQFATEVLSNADNMTHPCCKWPKETANGRVLPSMLYNFISNIEIKDSKADTQTDNSDKTAATALKEYLKYLRSLTN